MGVAVNRRVHLRFLNGEKTRKKIAKINILLECISAGRKSIWEKTIQSKLFTELYNIHVSRLLLLLCSGHRQISLLVLSGFKLIN